MKGGNRLLLRPVVVFLLVLLLWHPTSSSLCFLFVLLCWYSTSSSTVLLTICYLHVLLCWHPSSGVPHLNMFVLLCWHPTTGVAHLRFSLSSCVGIQLVQLCCFHAAVILTASLASKEDGVLLLGVQNHLMHLSNISAASPLKGWRLNSSHKDCC